MTRYLKNADSTKDTKNQNKSSGTIYHASPKGVSIREDTNNKSSATSSGAWKHRLRTKGWNYHASPKGVSIMNDTNNEKSCYSITAKFRLYV
jgi:hypothetical protein